MNKKETILKELKLFKIGDIIELFRPDLGKTILGKIDSLVPSNDHSGCCITYLCKEGTGIYNWAFINKHWWDVWTVLSEKRELAYVIRKRGSNAFRKYEVVSI